VIRTGRGEGGIHGGEVRKQSRVGKGQVKNRRVMISCEREPSVDPGCVEQRKQISSCRVKVTGAYQLVVIGV